MNERIMKIEKTIGKMQKKMADDDSDEEVYSEAFIKVCFFFTFCFNINNNLY